MTPDQRNLFFLVCKMVFPKAADAAIEQAIVNLENAESKRRDEFVDGIMGCADGLAHDYKGKFDV